MAGCYGKIPALGDFLSRNLPAAFVEAWDGWLRRAMAACAHGSDDGWTDLYLAAPIWRFLLAPGAVGEAGRAGVLVPSVDRIGRCFPLTIATDIPDGMPPTDMLDCWADGFERAEIVAIGTIGRALEPEAFVERVAGLPAPTPAAPPTLGRWAPPDCPVAGTRTAGAAEDSAGGRALLGDLAMPLLATLPQSWSLWWHLGWEQRPATTVLFAGLPAPEAAAAMLLGTWTEGGWSG